MKPDGHACAQCFVGRSCGAEQKFATCCARPHLRKGPKALNKNTQQLTLHNPELATSRCPAPTAAQYTTTLQMLDTH